MITGWLLSSMRSTVGPWVPHTDSTTVSSNSALSLT
jgi:hypothetical protein